MGMLRALRRHRQARFLGRHRQRVLRWAVGAARGGRPRTPETVERITRGEAARHGACCKGHKEWERLHNLAWVEQEFPDDWDTEGRGVALGGGLGLPRDLPQGASAARWHCVLTEIRRSIAVALAILVTLASLGRVSVNWTGGPAATPGDADEGRPVSTQQVGGR
jgi:hypothetical protein